MSSFGSDKFLLSRAIERRDRSIGKCSIKQSQLIDPAIPPLRHVGVRSEPDRIGVTGSHRCARRGSDAFPVFAKLQFLAVGGYDNVAPRP